jgi:hypothetical protein
MAFDVVFATNHLKDALQIFTTFGHIYSKYKLKTSNRNKE